MFVFKSTLRMTKWLLTKYPAFIAFIVFVIINAVQHMSNQLVEIYPFSNEIQQTQLRDFQENIQGSLHNTLLSLPTMICRMSFIVSSHNFCFRNLQFLEQ